VSRSSPCIPQSMLSWGKVSWYLACYDHIQRMSVGQAALATGHVLLIATGPLKTNDYAVRAIASHVSQTTKRKGNMGTAHTCRQGLYGSPLCCCDLVPGDVRLCCGFAACSFLGRSFRLVLDVVTHMQTRCQHSLGSLNIHALDIFLEHVSPRLMDLFTPKLWCRRLNIYWSYRSQIPSFLLPCAHMNRRQCSQVDKTHTCGYCFSNSRSSSSN
jgi:hypothetical protein